MAADPSAVGAEWTTVEIIDWLATLGIGPRLAIDLPIVPGPYIPKMPDVLAVVTSIGGAGEIMDGIGDILGFQLFVRSKQNQPWTGELLAKQADRRIRFADVPVNVAGGQLRLISVRRSGGAPSAISQMEDDGNRTPYTCNYLTTILR